ncbi:MAG: PAS domain S-box protein [Coleofasciculus sp. D1-CHI-01]|uniref:PAS domain S-box protein n=1 Tax=Coleofasciculus sp. D1-CHI-01 TaxID=3068482 RepID=UPI0032FFB124
MRFIKIYAVVAILWISLSDYLLAHLIESPVVLTELQTLKGLLFILISSLCLHRFIHKQHNRDIPSDPSEINKLLNQSQSILYTCQPEGDYLITYITQNIQDLLGYTPDYFYQNSDAFFNHIHPDDLPQVLTEISHLFAQEYHSLDYRFRHKNGDYRWLNDRLKLIRDEDGTPLKILGCLLDITQRKQAEFALDQLNQDLERKVADRTAKQNILNQELEQILADLRVTEEELRWQNQELIHAQIVAERQQKRYQDLFDFAPDGCLVTDKQGFIQEINQSITTLLDLDKSFFLGKSLNLFVAPGERDKYSQFLNQDTPNTPHKTQKLTLKQPWENGIKFTAAVRRRTLEDDHGSVIGFHWLIRDITSQKQLEQALRHSKKQYRTLAKSCQDIIFSINANLTLTYINEFGANLLGFVPQALINKPFDQFFILNKFERLEFSLQKVLRTGLPSRIEDRLLHPSCLLWLDTALFPLKNEAGTVTGVLGVARDITQLKGVERLLRQTQAKLQQREKLMRLTLEQAPIGIITTDLSGQFISTNYAFYKILGYSAEEFGELSWQDILDENHSASYQLYYQQLQQGDNDSIQWEQPLKHREGYLISSIICLGLIRDLNEQPLQYIAHIEDISDRKQAEAQLQASLREKEILLKEIHHRVKNNLMIVASLFTLQSLQVTDQRLLTILKDSQNRVKSMAMIHEILYDATDLSEIPLKDYIERLINTIVSTYRRRRQSIAIHFDIEPIALNIDTAVPCGLILNELITNSLKYAFPDDKSGEVGIALHTLEPHHYILSVWDNGIGFPEALDFRRTDSLGMQLVCDLTRQLKGTVELDCSQGTRFQIRFRERKVKNRLVVPPENK